MLRSVINMFDPFNELKRRYRNQLPPEKELLNLIREGERNPFDFSTGCNCTNDLERILEIHRAITGWTLPSEKFAMWLLRRKK